jgi:hypothetical protein
VEGGRRPVIIDAVKVSITRGGGFAGITTRTELSSQSLPPDAAHELERLALAVAPPEQPPTRHPDELHYSVTVDDDEATTARYSDSTLPEGVRRLIAWIDQRPERSEQLGRSR